MSSTPERKSSGVVARPSSTGNASVSPSPSALPSTGSPGGFAVSNPVSKGAPVSSSTTSTASVVVAGMGSLSGVQPSTKKAKKN